MAGNVVASTNKADSKPENRSALHFTVAGMPDIPRGVLYKYKSVA